jgi:hypothetical protein
VELKFTPTTRSCNTHQPKQVLRSGCWWLSGPLPSASCVKRSMIRCSAVSSLKSRSSMISSLAAEESSRVLAPMLAASAPDLPEFLRVFSHPLVSRWCTWGNIFTKTGSSQVLLRRGHPNTLKIYMGWDENSLRVGQSSAPYSIYLVERDFAPAGFVSVLVCCPNCPGLAVIGLLLGTMDC